MSIKLRNPKGTMDYMPEGQRVKQELIKKLQNVFEKYGYQPMETPILCYFNLLASKYAGGAEIIKEVYKLSDQGLRELGLRYDLTVPLAKVIGMNPELRLPFKRYEIGKVFRDGPVKTGRNREFTQCDVDIVGAESVIAEAELLIMAAEVYGMLGLDVYISYNNRRLLTGIIQSLSIGDELVPTVILTLDKLLKIGFEAVERELAEKGIEKPVIERLLDYMGMDTEDLMGALMSQQPNDLIINGIKEIEQLKEYTEAAGITDVLRFTPSLARGLEIYTGTVWEVFLTDGSITSSLGAGGRYDQIIGGFIGTGREYPAVGMTFGLDVIYEALLQGKGIESNAPTDFYIIPLGTEKECLKLLAAMRNSGLRVDIDMTGRKLKKILDYVNIKKILYVIILGENELAVKKVRLRNMRTGEELLINLIELIKTANEKMEKI